MIFVAFGYLVTLVEDAPSDWQDLFTDFQSELSRWREKNLQTLEQLANQTETIQVLAESSTVLSTSSTEWLNHSVELMQPLQECSQTISRLIAQLKSSNSGVSRDVSKSLELTSKELQKQMSSLSQSIDLIHQDLQKQMFGLSGEIKNLRSKLVDEFKESQNSQSWTLILNVSSLVVSVFMLALLFNNTFGQNRLKANQQQLMQKTEWLLKKANRWECQQGIKAPDSVECQSLNE